MYLLFSDTHPNWQLLSKLDNWHAIYPFVEAYVNERRGSGINAAAKAYHNILRSMDPVSVTHLAAIHKLQYHRSPVLSAIFEDVIEVNESRERLKAGRLYTDLFLNDPEINRVYAISAPKALLAIAAPKDEVDELSACIDPALLISDE